MHAMRATVDHGCTIVSPDVKPPILGDACIRVRIKYFYSWTLLNKIREGVALSPLSILHKTH